ncbi:hypothetical protein PHLCEN_2v11743 [Hermanssonia centrifuga]|uniref:Uncharacterized protein n=1 Tax=Hermanssonia centrifuga TaxID=98765 RepID=A0A2R6NJ59_9APHY|nr:hypothetical protein PHLCEN_2v11743 [Hermanssonia centrifuga]
MDRMLMLGKPRLYRTNDVPTLHALYKSSQSPTSIRRPGTEEAQDQVVMELLRYYGGVTGTWESSLNISEDGRAYGFL